MDLQSESSGPPPCDPQPPGKINKAAFKLFGKRRAGSAVPSIFSVRGRGEGPRGPAKPPLGRSRTHDGLAAAAEPEAGRREASAGGEQPHGSGEPGPRAPVPKSLSFFSLLRRNGRGGAGAEPRPPKQRKGLRGLFSSIRWSRGRDKGGRAGPGAGPGEGVLLASRSNSVEIMKEDVALSLQPQPRVPETAAPTEPPAEPPPAAGDSGSSAPGDAGRSREPEDAVTEPRRSPERRDPGPAPAARTPAPPSQESPAPSPQKPSRAALKPKPGSPDTRLLSPTPAMTVTPPESQAADPPDPPSEPSMDRFCSMFTDVTSLKSFDSLTGCGDIIADTEEEGASGSGSSSGTGSSSGDGAGGGARGGAGAAAGDRPSPARAAPPPPPAPVIRTPTPPPSPAPSPAPCPAPAVLKAREPAVKPQGSGVVAYMGGGEEMASPDEVDDADMQGLWHMLPQKGEDSPAPPRADPAPRPDCRPPPVKALGLSKIPVSGGGRGGKPSREAPPEEGRGKDPLDAPSNSDEGYWDSTTPGPEEEGGGFPARDGLPRDSCSGDALYDLYDPEETPGGVVSDEEVTPPSGRGCRLTPPPQGASFRSLRGSTSLPRDSRIPISIKQTPPSHSASQGALTPAPAPAPHASGKADAPRTKIPVSKVPIRRASNKPVAARPAPNRK